MKDEEVLKKHEKYKGKIQTKLKVPVKSYQDYSVWYTPGVASVSRTIAKNKENVFRYTNKGNLVAIVSDGTRVLGLGDIGPEAALPVMEGKALLFKQLGGVDAFPIVLGESDEKEIIKTVKNISPSFGGINLEDLENPKCFSLLDTLREELEIPVWHDDQQGTAAVTLAGVINGLKMVNKDLGEVKLSVIGAGAANIAFLRVLFKSGVDPGNVFVVDSKGILHKDREDLKQKRETNPYKWNLCSKTNKEGREGGKKECIRGTDVLVAASTPGPGVIKPEWIRGMNRKPIVFPMANPVPEIHPLKAKQAGAEIVGTGRSDFPNQVNNSIGFPGIFRGVLDVRAKKITDSMTISAAEAIALTAGKKGLRKNYILPRMDEPEVFMNEAVAVGMKAIEEGLARKELSRKKLREKAKEKIG